MQRKDLFPLLLLISFGLLQAGRVGAQDKIVVQSTPIGTPIQVQKEKTVPEKAPDFSKEALVYEKVRGKLRYEMDGTGTIDTYAKLRVQSYAGVQKTGQLIFNYDSANEQLEVRLIRVTKPDGKVISAGADAVQDLSSPIAEAAPTYTDLRQKHVVVPALSPGDILEYETVGEFKPLTAGKFWQVWNVITDAICLDEEVELNVPKAANVKTKFDGNSNPKSNFEGDRQILIWSTSNLKLPEAQQLPGGFNVEKLLQGPRAAKTRRLLISSFANWSEVSTWYAGLERERRVPTKEVKAKADEVVGGAQSDLERVQAIYEYVARSIRYVSLSFGVGRYQPHAAGEVLAHQYGDCKDKATLLEAMLEAEGITASPVLLQTDGDVDPEVPMPLQFDHAISYVRLGEKDLWLDSTTGVGPFEYLLPQVRGKKALVVNSSHYGELVEIPKTPALPTLYRVSVEGEVNDQRKLDAQLVFETRGDWEVLFRLGLTQVSLSQFSELMAAGARQAGKNTDVSFSDLEASDPFDTRKPLRMKVRMTTTMPEDEEGEGKEKKAAASGSPFDAAEFGFLLPFVVGTKDSDLKGYLGGPKEMALHLKFSAPPKVSEKRKAGVGEPVKISKDYAEYESSWKFDGQTLEGDWWLKLKVNELTNEQATDYVDFRTQVLATLTEFSSKLTGKEGTYQAAAKVGRYSQALSAQRSGKTDEARKILQELVKEDPKYADAWRSLGQVEEQRRNWTKSREAYQKVTELEPGNYSGYEGMIRGYSAERMYDEAIATAKKEVEKTPGQVYGHNQLGWLYLQTEKYEQSAHEYEISANLLPKSPRVQILLGQAYAGVHRKEKAQAAFEKAVELDQSALTLNDAAYFAAEAGLDLQKAEERSKRAVTEIEQKVGEIKLEKVNAGTGLLLGTLAAYWDTLGWIEFKKGNLAGAEKYLRAASDLTDAGTIQMHMGRVYEAQGRKEEAIYAYSRTLLPTTDRSFRFDMTTGKSVEMAPRPLNPDEREARKHVAGLLGGEDKIAELLQESSYNRNWKRTVTTPHTEGTDYWVHIAAMVSPGPKIESVRKLQGKEDEKALMERFKGATPPQTFPDSVLQHLPRVAGIHCLKEPAQCELAFLPNEQWVFAFADGMNGAAPGPSPQ